MTDVTPISLGPRLGRPALRNKRSRSVSPAPSGIAGAIAEGDTAVGGMEGAAPDIPGKPTPNIALRASVADGCGDGSCDPLPLVMILGFTAEDGATGCAGVVVGTAFAAEGGDATFLVFFICFFGSSSSSSSFPANPLSTSDSLPSLDVSVLATGASLSFVVRRTSRRCSFFCRWIQDRRRATNGIML